MKSIGVKEAADILLVHENRVLELAADGRIPAAKIGRKWVFNEEDVISFRNKEISRQTAARKASSLRAA